MKKRKLIAAHIRTVLTGWISQEIKVQTMTKEKRSVATSVATSEIFDNRAKEVVGVPGKRQLFYSETLRKMQKASVSDGPSIVEIIKVVKTDIVFNRILWKEKLKTQ